MLADRDYMREPARSEPLRATTKLIIANVACFIIFNIFGDISRKPDLQHLLYLSQDGVMHGYVWQFFSFQFLHSNLLHLLFNCVGLYFFGRLVEDRLTRVRFLQLYIISGLLGGVAQVLAGLVSTKFGGAVLGASAGVSALLAAFSLMYWHQRFKVLLFFFIPVEITGQFLFWLGLGSSLAGIALAGLVTSSGSNIAHVAHLGGFFAAFLFINKDGQPAPLSEWFDRRSTTRRPKTLVNAGAGMRKPSAWGGASSASSREEEAPQEDFISKEVDPILDKISAKGIHSLTEQERKILDKARSKMAKK